MPTTWSVCQVLWYDITCHWQVVGVTGQPGLLVLMVSGRGGRNVHQIVTTALAATVLPLGRQVFTILYGTTPRQTGIYYSGPEVSPYYHITLLPYNVSRVNCVASFNISLKHVKHKFLSVLCSFTDLYIFS